MIHFYIATNYLCIYWLHFIYREVPRYKETSQVYLCFQITETQYKQFHPDIFHSPWVSVYVKGRIQIHMWAVVIIQRAFRNYRKRREARLQAKKKVSNTQERWRKKAEGDQYRPPSQLPTSPPRHAAARAVRQSEALTTVEVWDLYKPILW